MTIMVMMAENNSSDILNMTQIDDDLGRMMEVYIVSTLLSVVIFATLSGNTFVIAAIFMYKPLRNVQNFLVISLALADMAVALIVMPFHISNTIAGHWLYGSDFCDIWLTSDILICTASIFNICGIALDRYFAIHDPINYASKRTTKLVLIMIFVIWGLAAVISVPPLLGWSDTGSLYDTSDHTCHLTDEIGFVIYSASGSFFIPLGIMSFVYLKIFLATRERLRKRAQACAASKLVLLSNGKSNTTPTVQVDFVSNESNNETTETRPPSINPSPLLPRNHKTSNETPPYKMKQFFEERQKISLSKEKKAARTLGMIMGAFIFCWLPFFSVYLLNPFCKQCGLGGSYLELALVILGYVNSCLNPIIYTIFNVEFRNAFRYMFAQFCCKNRKKNRIRTPKRALL